MTTTSTNEMQSAELIPGLHFKLFHTDQVTLSFVRVEEGAVLPEHAHPQEQITIVQKGKLELTVAGNTTVLEPGGIIHIPSDAMHSGVAHSECEVLDVFHPVREDLK